MNTEIYATLSILLVCSVALAATDALVCGILKFSAGIPFRKAFLWGCVSLLIPPVATAYGALVERNLFKVKRIEISCEGLPESFEGYRIAHISDIHARSFQDRDQRMRKVVEKMNQLNPDMVAFTGDLITMEPSELDGLADILSDITAADGVFSVLGNHDYCMYSNTDTESKKKNLAKLIDMEYSMGWALLMNDNRVISRGSDSIAVVGVENTSPSRHFPSKGNLPKASEGTDGLFRILLSHDPLHWEAEITGKDYPLTLSGHTHAMQLSLFGWSPSRLIFPQYRGLYTTEMATGRNGKETVHVANGQKRTAGHQGKSAGQKKKQYLYVNTGLGETIFPARIGVRPEITLITLRTER